MPHRVETPAVGLADESRSLLLFLPSIVYHLFFASPLYAFLFVFV